MTESVEKKEPPKPTIMVCSRCGVIIARTIPGTVFDIYNCSWKCKACGTTWFTDDGWETVNTLLIPWRASDKGLPYCHD